MFANFDFDVIRRSLPYLFYDGMTFTLMLTALSALGGLAFGTLIALMRLSGVKPLARQAHRPVRARHDDRLTDVAVAARVHMRPQGQAHQLPGAAL